MNAAGGRVEAAPRSVAARARARERLAAEAGRTYLAAMLLEQDSLLRRWPDARFVRPLRLAVLRTPAVLNFREEFVANVNWAVARWNGAMLPVRIEAGADSTNADIVLTWVARLDSNRTGRADLTWSARGHIVHAHVVLATHTPRGEPLDSPQMTALALHELGHALGLGHSPEPGDALHAVTRAIELTERDRRTARVLYELPPGTVK
jgi:predicted Zn-dependent protease